jgi:hypothetical protein
MGIAGRKVAFPNESIRLAIYAAGDMSKATTPGYSASSTVRDWRPTSGKA